MLLSISLMLRRFLQPLQEDNALTGNLGAASDNSLQPTTPSQPKATERLPDLNQKSGEATVPPIRKLLHPIRNKRDQTCVVKDIYLHFTKPLKAVHGAKIVAKMPLPPIRARVPNNDAKKEPFQPVRPEGSPRPAASKFRRQVVKKHIQFKTLTVQDLSPCPDEMVWVVFNSEAEQVMAYLKAKLISVTQELNLIKGVAKMDAQALEEKNAKEQEEEERRKEVMKNGGEEGSVASKPKQTAAKRYVSRDRVQVKKSVNEEDEKKKNGEVNYRLEKHSKICAKLSSKSSRRGVYESTKHRLKGTELAGYVKRSVV
ncbi:unnamed protein product [Coregonus sp. 'balchen']|nr:unnamed protein product [Coregonus sp. 'balchen']